MSMRRVRFATPLLACALALPGCSSLLTEGTTDAAAIAGAGIAGAITKNATVGAAIGIGVKSIADLGLRYIERRVHGTEQDTIATAAGTLQPGAVGTWQVAHDLPIEPDEHGAVVVAREFGADAFTCREIVFSVDGKPAQGAPPEGAPRAFYTATICRDGEVWKWATAEPATARWGGLQ